jgi:glycosyltransferase involved in cell wall biosynthesis
VQKAKSPPPQPDGLGLRRVRIRPRPVGRWWSRWRWVLPGGPPRSVAGWGKALQDDLRAWADPSYDVVWVLRAPTIAAVGFPSFGPVVVDLDDLEDQKASERVAVTRGLAALSLRADAARWRRWQRSIAGRAAAVAVCSDADRMRVDAPNTVVIPNGYARTGTGTRGRPDGPPTILLQGSLMRPPLVDAARVLVRDVLPSVREEIPDVTVDLVGDSDERMQELADTPGVRVHGRVPSMMPFLEKAGVVAIPMRWGSGTRIKILEAFANGVPVVSSTIGAEGLDVVNGRDILIADDPKDLAAACVRVLRDPALGERLAASAAAVYEERYRWEPIRRLIGTVAQQVAGGVPTSSPAR